MHSSSITKPLAPSKHKLPYEIPTDMPGENGSMKISDTIIIGMGPAGLACAVLLILAGIDVTLLEKRTNFSRSQKVLLQYKTIQDLWSLTGLSKKRINLEKTKNSFRFKSEIKIENLSPQDIKDYQFFSALQKNYSCIAIMDLQEYQLNTLIHLSRMSQNHMSTQLTHQENNKLEYTKLGNLSIYTGIDVLVDESSSKIKMKIKKGLSHIDSEQDFKKIICATGGSIENIFTNPPYSFTRQELPSPRHRFFSSVTFECLDTSVPLGLNYLDVYDDPNKQVKWNNDDLNKLKKLGWTQPYFPISVTAIIEGNSDSCIHACITGESPDPKTNKSFDSVQWARFILEKQHGIKSEVLGETVENNTFSIRATCTETNYIYTQSGSEIFLIGDLAVSSNLTFGNGTLEAIDSAKEVATLFAPHKYLGEVTGNKNTNCLQQSSNHNNNFLDSSTNTCKITTDKVMAYFLRQRIDRFCIKQETFNTNIYPNTNQLRLFSQKKI